MQLSVRKKVSAALSALTANLLAASPALAQNAAYPQNQDAASDSYDASADVGTDLGSGVTRIDSAVLFYQEDGGRVRAVEPVVSASLNSDDGRVLSVRLTADTLTGATPNGATPWRQDQTFVTPAQAPGTTTTVTRPSGNSVIVTVPGTGTVVRQYTTPAGQLPVDSGFRDQRYAIDLAYSAPLGAAGRYSIGGGYSTERDYRSYSLTAGYSQDFNGHNTTLSAGFNLEHDDSFPAFGVPTPLAIMTGLEKGPTRSKTVDSIVLGLTQAVNRYWLAQLNYSYGLSNGYQTDPYRIISVVDGVSASPLEYLYESRPERRVRQSVYLGNRVALGPTVASLSLRAYHDDWGINSVTVEAADHIPLFSHFYAEPSYRYYHQTAADFYRHYLIGSDALPQYASSDGRLGDFDARTTGIEVGYKFGPSSTIYARYADYTQTGQTHPTDAVGDLADQNLFDGVSARSFMVGLSFAFR